MLLRVPSYYKKLCDICIYLGEEALSEVCTEYPRFTMEYADVREKALSLSCEEVGRIVFSSVDCITFEEMELPTSCEEAEAWMAVASYITIRDMDVMRYFENGQEFTLEDRIDTVRIYAKEVEHSEDNLDMLADAFSFEEVFRVEQMIKQI